MKRSLSFFLLGMFLLSFAFLFSIHFVSANIVTDPIIDAYASWSKGEISNGLSKFLLWGLVSIIVYGIGSFIPGLEKSSFVTWIFAIVVGFLSVAYLNIDEVGAMMIGYGALGFSLGIGIPFIVLVAFTFRVGSTAFEKKSAEYLATKLVAFLLWGLFTAFSFSRAIDAPDNYALISWSIALIALVITLALNFLFGWIAKQMISEVNKKSKTTTEMSAEYQKSQAEAAKILGA